MGMAKQKVIDYFGTQNITPDDIGENALRASGNFDGGKLDIYMFFDSDDRNVQIVGANFCYIPAEKNETMLKVVNALNEKFRFYKFILDEKHNTIRAEMDAVIQLDSCGVECWELVVRLVSIVGSAYPEIMRGIWA